MQLGAVLRSMARAWEGTSARLLRQAKGAPADAGLGLVVQQMALGWAEAMRVGRVATGGQHTGLPQDHGRYLQQSQGREALAAMQKRSILQGPARTVAGRNAPEAFDNLKPRGLMRESCAKKCRSNLASKTGVCISGRRAGARVVHARRCGLRCIGRRQIIPRKKRDAGRTRTLNELLHRQVTRTQSAK